MILPVNVEFVGGISEIKHKLLLLTRMKKGEKNLKLPTNYLYLLYFTSFIL